MNKNQNITLNLPEYNKETGKHTITLEIEATKKKYDYKVFDFKACVKVWEPIILIALQARLKACKTKLTEAILRDDVVETSEFGIRYLQNGIVRHYSYPAATAMQNVIASITEPNGMNWLENVACTQQVLKALNWLPEEARKSREGYPFQVLIDGLWECHVVAHSHQYMPE